MNKKNTEDLLTRLKALKPSTSVVSKPTAPTGPRYSTISSKPSNSWENALSARLKVLRDANPPPATPSSTQLKSPITSPAAPDANKQTTPATVPDISEISSIDYDEELSELSELLEDRDGPEWLAPVSPDTPKASSPAPQFADGDSDNSDSEEMKKNVNEILKSTADDVSHNDAEESDCSLNLPSVPDIAPASAPDTKTNTLTGRLSSLHIPASISQSPLSSTNSLSLPSVPKSAPTYITCLKSITKHTDEDTETWCTVCTEDGTLCCIECSELEERDILYCTNCWYEIHKGPMASFDTIHRAVRFIKPQKKVKENKKRMLVGA